MTDTYGPVRRLVERTIISEETRSAADNADDVAACYAELERICAEADALDAELDPHALTAAWLHGANTARQRAQWPQGEQAAEQLAEALYSYVVVEDEDDLVRIAAAVLKRLAAQEKGEG